MGRTGLALLALAALAGCATPLQQCLVQADRDRVTVQRELDERRQNLRRGSSIERVTVPVLMPGFCVGPGGAAATCLRWEHETQEIFHPINPEFEAERIALLERQLARAAAAQEQAAAQCRAAYPE